MEQSKIDRINELARKKKAEGLTPEELEEQAALRAEYIAGFRASLTAQLDNTVVVDPDGNRTKVTRKNPIS
ncbi:MAG: DUF896 domain-containing protein [Ruminococcaceae bacterium]|nr:DUF896 domain-containing protein [Oscillospiraceae bacterium]